MAKLGDGQTINSGPFSRHYGTSTKFSNLVTSAISLYMCVGTSMVFPRDGHSLTLSAASNNTHSQVTSCNAWPLDLFTCARHMASSHE